MSTDGPLPPPDPREPPDPEEAADRDAPGGDPQGSPPRLPEEGPLDDDDLGGTDTVWLVDQHRRGSPDAASRLFDKHAGRIRRIARARLGTSNPMRDVMDSGDLTQEALLKAFRGLDRLEVREKGQFLGWVARIVENTLRDAAEAQRAAKRDRERARSTDEDGDLVREVPGREPTPPDQMIDGEEAAELVAAVESLAADEQRVLVLRQEGLTFARVADELGLGGEDGARSVFQRAVRHLRRRLRVEE